MSAQEGMTKYLPLLVTSYNVQYDKTALLSISACFGQSWTFSADCISHYTVYNMGFMTTNNEQALLITRGKLAEMLFP